MQENKGKLVILGVLIVALAVVGLLLSRKTNTTQTIAGTAFSLSTSIYDLSTPLGVAVDSDENIYVSDTGHSQVIVFDRDGVQLYKIEGGTDEKGQDFKFYSPYGLAIDDANNKLYVCDYTIRVMDKTGNYLYTLQPPPETVQNAPGSGTARPNEVALYKDKVFVTSRDGVYVFDDKGKFLNHFGTRGAAVGQFDFPNGIAIDPNTGNIFVADTNNARLVSMTPDGKTRWVVGAWDDAKISSPFHLIRSLAMGPDGLLYVSDVPDRVLVMDTDGNLKSVIGERGTEDTKLNFPEGIAVNPANKLYIADRENNRVQVWQLSPEMPAADNLEVEKFKKASRKFEGMAASGSTTTSTTASPAASGQ